MEAQGDQIEQDGPKRWRWRWRLRLRLADMFWLMIVAAVLLLWYQDREQLQRKLTGQTQTRGSSWSIDQLLGKPNTPLSGDQSTAWAPLNQDGGTQWVIAEFPTVVNVSSIEVVETYNPGALVRVTSISVSGVETEIWSGTDPVVPVAGMGTASIIPSTPTRTRRIKVELDTNKVSGWNEIDAIAILDRDGNAQWASRAWASSAYGLNRKAPSWFWP